MQVRCKVDQYSCFFYWTVSRTLIALWCLTYWLRSVGINCMKYTYIYEVPSITHISGTIQRYVWIRHFCTSVTFRQHEQYSDLRSFRRTTLYSANHRSEEDLHLCPWYHMWSIPTSCTYRLLVCKSVTTAYCPRSHGLRQKNELQAGVA